MLTLTNLWQNLLRDPRAEFMVSPTHRVTYGTLKSQIGGWLSVFDNAGIASGDCFLLVTNDEVAASSAYLAALLDGVVPVMLAPDTKAERAASIAASVNAKLIISDLAAPDWAGDTPVFRVAAPPKGRWSIGRPAQALDLPEATRAPHLPESPDALAYLLFTSGTTQAPSGVMISRRNLLANLTTLSRLFGYDQETRIFNDMVLAHADGMIQGPVMALANGCAVVRSGGFSVQQIEAWLNRVRQERATHFVTVPTIWSMIDRYASHDDYFDAPECQVLMSVAARLDPQMWEKLEKRFARPLINQYGLTETVASALYAGDLPEMGARGTVGKPVDCEARCLTESSEPSELLLRGDNIFTGYWKDPDRTAETFTSDGWMRTGDLAVRLPDGSFDIRGRLKTVIMSGGFLIRPEEIDEVLMRHPAVAEVATVAYPDTDFGDIPVSAVVLDGSADEAALTAHARAHLEALKVPKRIVILPEIPRGLSGKAQMAPLIAVMGSHMSGATGHAAASDDLPDTVCAIAAEVFRVDRSVLDPKTTAADIAGWDSFSQISLIFAIEDHFKIRIPPSRAAGLRSLGEFISTVRQVSA